MISGQRDAKTFATLARGVVETGYRALKVDPFGKAAIELSTSEQRRVIELLETVRDAIGPERELMIEMHGRLAPDIAARIALAVETVQPAWVEEPVGPENVPGLRRVREATALPIATGERLHSLGDFRACRIAYRVPVRIKDPATTQTISPEHSTTADGTPSHCSPSGMVVSGP